MLLGPEPPSEAEALGARFRAAWTVFAATSDPGCDPLRPPAAPGPGPRRRPSGQCLPGRDLPARLAGLLYMLIKSEGGHDQRGANGTHPLYSPAARHHDRGQREAVTRTFSEMQERGCIEVKSRRVYVRNFDLLLQNAGE